MEIEVIAVVFNLITVTARDHIFILVELTVQ